MAPMGVGVIGTGDISNVYFANLRKYPRIVSLVGCTNRTVAKARAQAARYGIERVYGSVDELLADPAVDMVLDLATPDAHADINIAALEAGKHVYTEKTLATTVADGRRILDLARSKGLAVGCAPDTWLGGRAQTFRAVMDSGTIGSVIGGMATVALPGLEWFHPSPAQSYAEGVGPLGDLGPYYLALLISLLGPVRRCAAMSRRPVETRTAHYPAIAGQPIDVHVDTHVIASLEFAGGPVVTLVTSFDVWDSQMPRIELYGTEGVLCMPDPDPLAGPNVFGGPVWLKTSETARFRDIPRPSPLPEWEEVPVVHRFNETDYGADPSVPRVNSRGIGLIDEVLAIRDHRPLRCSGEMGLHVREIIEAIFRSAAEHRFVELTTTCERPQALPADFPDSEG